MLKFKSEAPESPPDTKLAKIETDIQTQNGVDLSAASSPGKIASSTEKIASPAEKIALSPGKIASSPQNIASSSENIASSPENIAPSTENIASSPENISSSPEKIALSHYCIAPGENGDKCISPETNAESTDLEHTPSTSDALNVNDADAVSEVKV